MTERTKKHTPAAAFQPARTLAALREKIRRSSSPIPMENLLQDKKIRIDPEWKEILERCEREGKDLLERMKTDPEYRALLEKLNREGERLLAEIRDKKISDV